MKDMNRNRHNGRRDETTRMVHSKACEPDRCSWLRTLQQIRAMAETSA